MGILKVKESNFTFSASEIAVVIFHRDNSFYLT